MQIRDDIVFDKHDKKKMNKMHKLHESLEYDNLYGNVGYHIREEIEKDVDFVKKIKPKEIHV